MDSQPDIADVVKRLRMLGRALVAAARLSALASIGEAEYRDQVSATTRTWLYLRAADDLLGVLNEYAYDRGTFVVSWPEPAIKRLAGGPDHESIGSAAAADEMELVADLALRWAVELRGDLQNSCLLRVSATAVEHACETLSRYSRGTDITIDQRPADWWSRALGDGEALSAAGANVAERRIRGPLESPIPRAFVRGPSLSAELAPAYGESISKAVPYMWCVSIREMMAADLCSLSLAEYDGLPITFYLDFAKQAVDEAGHALCFFDTATELFEELAEDPIADPVALTAINTFRATGSGLPVPREGNLYEAIWAASLSERLVIMHHDTEGPAVKRLGQRSQGEFCKTHPSVENVVLIDRYDEMSHAAIGARWLRYLYPTSSLRKEAIAEARRMRGMLLLGAFAAHGPESLKDLALRYRERPISNAA